MWNIWSTVLLAAMAEVFPKKIANSCGQESKEEVLDGVAVSLSFEIGIIDKKLRCCLKS